MVTLTESDSAPAMQSMLRYIYGAFRKCATNNEGTKSMSNAKQTRVCGNRMCGQAFVAGPRYKASWCGPCKNWLALYGDIRNPNRS